MSDRHKPASETSWNLLPLTPEYIAKEHDRYVRAIEAALGNDQIRNIALSGNYGVGKSSILREVAQRRKERVVELSLSTLAPIETSDLDDAVPKQATTPTNRIQQEIVKQLIYRENSSKTPGSRFRRIERFRWGREIVAAILLGLLLAVIFLLTGWTSQVTSEFSPLGDIGVRIHLIIWSGATGMALLVRWLFYGKLHVKQFSAGSATVTLDDNSVSYFDQYLDEIVYFFEVSDRNVVIFEDIDRFNDSHIFETLRALNTLLNASPQVDKPIRFIYAIKDSIFDRIGLEEEGRKLEQKVLAAPDPAEAEAIRANRTKFFDLVVPVVPFITHRSARNLVVQLLDQIEHEVASELLDLAAQYVPDMRLLKNVRNEFIVFRDRIFSGDGKLLKLNETDLFAMMLYKSTHLTDFETIRLGKSKLDILYKISRELVTENIKRIEGEHSKLRQQLSRINGAATRSTRLGERLLKYMQRTVETAGYTTQNEKFTFKGSSLSADDLKGANFWADFVSSETREAVLQWRAGGRVLSFSRNNLKTDLGDPLDAESWNEMDRESLNEQIDDMAEDVKFLRGADLGDLVKRPEFCVEYEGAEQSFESIAQELLEPGLACQLVRAGYINSNFTLYTSTFHGERVSPAATNFIIHHVERDLMDEHFELAPDDVDAVVRERGKNALKESALYNIAILDRLLAIDINAADIMIRSLVGLGERQKRFLQAYFAAGDKRARFIERFTVFSSRALTYLVSQTELDDVSRLELVDIALASLPDLKQRTDSAVPGYLSAHYTEFTVLTSDMTVPVQAERIGTLFADENITVPRLESLGLQVRSSFVARSLYEVTYENLVIAIDNRSTVALDVIRATNTTVYDYVLGHLNTYLEAIDDASATIDASEHFIAVIEDVLEQDKSCLDEVIKHAVPDCQVVDLAEVSEGLWPVLAEHLRFSATFDNVSGYVESLGAVDAHLAKVLAAAGEIAMGDSAEEEQKAGLAIAILGARDQLSSAALRAELIASLDLDNYLGIDEIEVEIGDLFALLLKHDIVADDAASYQYLSSADWPTRKAYIRESAKFKSYMTPELVRQDLAVLLRSDDIDSAVKGVILEQATDYAEVAGLGGLNELARFATRHGSELPLDIVQKMAEVGVSAEQIVLLLNPHLTSISRGQLFTVLRALGGDYLSLTEVGRTKPRVPNTPADRMLLERLKREGIVSRYDEKGAQIKVHKKYK